MLAYSEQRCPTEGHGWRHPVLSWMYGSEARKSALCLKIRQLWAAQAFTACV